MHRNTVVTTLLALASSGAFLAGPSALGAAPVPQEPASATADGDAQDVTGRWTGVLDAGPQGEITMTFEVTAAEDGGLTSTLDVPTQGARDIPTGETALSGDSLTITVPAIQGRFTGVLASPDTLTGTWSQGAAELPLTLVRTDDDEPELERPQHPEPPYPYVVEEVSYEHPAEGFTIAGTFTRPEGTGPFPGVLLITGSGPQDRDESLMGHKPFLVLADHLTRSGVAVLRVDDRGVGGSGGDFDSATSEDFASDVRAGVTWLEERDDVAEVGLIGHSEGALVGPMVAARDERVDFLVLLAGPGVPGSEILAEQGALISRATGLPEEVVEASRSMMEKAIAAVVRLGPEEREDSVTAILAEAARSLEPETRKAAGIPPGDVAAWAETRARGLSTPWMAFFLGHDPRPDLRAVDVPVLAVGGSLDLQVPAERNLAEIEAALRAGGNERVTVRELEGLNHLFQHAETGSPAEYGSITETFAPEALELVSTWIREVAGS